MMHWIPRTPSHLCAQVWVQDWLFLTKWEVPGTSLREYCLDKQVLGNDKALISQDSWLPVPAGSLL